MIGSKVIQVVSRLARRYDFVRCSRNIIKSGWQIFETLGPDSRALSEAQYRPPLRLEVLLPLLHLWLSPEDLLLSAVVGLLPPLRLPLLLESSV